MDGSLWRCRVGGLDKVISCSREPDDFIYLECYLHIEQYRCYNYNSFSVNTFGIYEALAQLCMTKKKFTSFFCIVSASILQLEGFPICRKYLPHQYKL